MLRKFKFHWNQTRIKDTLHEDQNAIWNIKRSLLLRMRNVSGKSCRENKSTHFVLSNFFFSRKSCRLWDNVEKYCRAGHARLQIHTLRLCNTHCLTTATMVARTRLNVTLYVHCLPCYVYRKSLHSSEKPFSPPGLYYVTDKSPVNIPGTHFC
jgi:hypothetical protein